MTDESFVKTILQHGEHICKQTNAVNTIIFTDFDEVDEKDIHEIDIDGYKIRVVLTEIK